MDRDIPEAAAEVRYRFGAYCLIPGQRLLLRGNEPMGIGARAFAVLVALVERAGTVVSAQELMRAAWPGVVVEEANLRVQVGTLRRLLKDSSNKRRAIETIPLQGYCFVFPVERTAKGSPEPPPGGVVQHSLPVELTSTVGRDATIDSLVRAIERRRLITLTGPGGIGKTTVALTVARKCMVAYPDGVYFVDLASITDPRVVPVAIASALGAAVPWEDPAGGLVAHLHGKQLVLILDTCEHLIEPVTLLTEKLLASLPQLRILATSRETLRARGEWVHRLQPLAVPPDLPGLRAADIVNYPAVELFIQRVASSVEGFELRDSDAPFVSQICRQLDGLPLAIELAAAHVDEIGLREVAACLNERLSILTRGRRTALPRQQTLAATMQWSYDLLSALERTVLGRLAVFPGSFTAGAAHAVATYDMNKHEARAALSSLHAKSLLTVEIGSEVVLYRLLYTTRCFATEKELPSGNWQATQRKHARFVLDAMRCAERDSGTLDAPVWTARYGHLSEDVRSALDWAFSPAGDRALAVCLTAASSPLWFVLSLPSWPLRRQRRDIVDEVSHGRVGRADPAQSTHTIEEENRSRVIDGVAVV